MDCVFCKIINKEIPSKIIYEDDDIIVFNDIEPIAKVHILVIPKKHIKNIANMEEEDINLIGKIFYKSKKLAQELKIDKTGYRILTNSGDDAGQTIHHLHFHILGGEKI